MQAPLQGRSWAGRDRWVEAVRWVALPVFLSIPFIGFFAPSIAGRVVWTVLIAGLPLFIVLVGYHRWRRICPLAFVAGLPERLGRPGRRRASAWFEANYYSVTFSIFVVSLWLRLIATNGNGRALAVFFVLVSLAALTCGFLFTGKTWCNYICPVSFIERLYTEPHGLRETPNSQCEKCTACKHACPDISEENAYWEEMSSRAKRFALLAFPGIVFGFYFYYYLQSGSWDYYFGGAWTYEPGVINSAFRPGQDKGTAGFFFLPELPRAVASILTLVACGLASYLLFSLLEQSGWLRRGEEEDETRLRHVTISLVAFVAFVTFYAFAGAPTLRRAPWLNHLVGIVVVMVATLSLVRRLSRSRRAFAEERLARNIIKRWGWSDLQPPRDLREAFLVHTIRTRETEKGYAQILQTYKEAVLETLADGFVAPKDLRMIESLRTALRIRQSDYDDMIAALAEEEEARLKKSPRELTTEKRLQLEGYAFALKRYLEGVLAAGGAPNPILIDRLRSDYRVSKEEHADVLNQLLNEGGDAPHLFLKAWDAEARANPPAGGGSSA
jgi:hypothetical protein